MKVQWQVTTRPANFRLLTQRLGSTDFLVGYYILVEFLGEQSVKLVKSIRSVPPNYIFPLNRKPVY